MSFRHTRLACYIGYITQAIINNFLPLLFLTLQRNYSISLEQIALLVTINFTVQMGTDALAARFADKLGYRKAMVAAHMLAGLGLGLLALLPLVMPPYGGLVIAICTYAVGGGLLEAVVSPIVEACPGDNKAGDMSLLHSFYCWGVVGVILLSTLFYSLFGINNWPYLAAALAAVPFINTVLFIKVPIRTLGDGHGGMKLSQLTKAPLFWLLMGLMLCAGASELAVNQWASAYVEAGLGVNKALGDLLGPCAFALAMGLARVLHLKLSHKIGLNAFMVGSIGLCIISYAVLSVNPPPVLGLMACALCGFSVGILWPGTFSIAAQALKTGGTAMFALLALGGDIGCALGPYVVGVVSGAMGDSLNHGFLAAMFFPVIMLFGLLCFIKTSAKSANQPHDPE